MYVKSIEFDIFIRVVNKYIVHEIILTKEYHVEYDYVYERDSFLEREGLTHWRKVRYLSAIRTWSGLPINSVTQGAKSGFTVRSSSVAGIRASSIRSRRASTRGVPGVRENNWGIEGS